MQKKITQSHPLLDENGYLLESGWATKLLCDYKRSKVKAHPLRIKEWDFYEIRNEKFGLFLVAYDVGYQGMIQAKFIDFERHLAADANAIRWFSKGSFHLPPSSETGDIHLAIKKATWNCEIRSDHRHFTFNFPDFQGGEGFSGEVDLFYPTTGDSIVNIIPFQKPTQFVYAQKINCMKPVGSFSVAGEEFHFRHSDSSWGCLDWTRAVFPYHTSWNWASASGKINDIPFGFNIDYGFGSESSKNMIFYNYIGHHLDEVTYRWNPHNFEDLWHFSSNDERVTLDLHPTFVLTENTNYWVLRMKVIKVYGYFSGTVVLDSGEPLSISANDKLFGHAEYVVNYW